MSARLLTEIINDLERQEKLCRCLGCHDLADKIGERICQRVIEHARDNPVQITPVHRVGVFKGHF